jgi:hypothetical protein
MQDCCEGDCKRIMAYDPGVVTVGHDLSWIRRWFRLHNVGRKESAILIWRTDTMLVTIYIYVHCPDLVSQVSTNVRS